MKISKKTEYGLTAMVFLAKNPIRPRSKGAPHQPFSLREIANKTRMPYSFLEKIFLKLEKAKLVKAKIGMRGGYSLAKPASKITIADIVKVLEKNLSVVHCQGCPMAVGCASKDVWGEVQQSLSKALGSIKLANLVNKKK